MKNILRNPQAVHLKYFINLGRISVASNSVKCFSNSLFGCRILNAWSPEIKTNVPLLKAHIGSLSTSAKKLEKLRKGGKEKEDCYIIYNGSLTHRIKGVKVFSFVTSIGGICIQPWILQSISTGSNMPVGVALLSCIGFFTFVTPFLCHLITRKYVTEIWYNSATDTYTATVLSFFLRRININFKIEDVRVPSIPPIFSTMCIKGRPVFVIVDSFLEVEHYIKMMGYDKPMDLKFNASPHTLDEPQNKDKTDAM